MCGVIFWTVRSLKKPLMDIFELGVRMALAWWNRARFVFSTISAYRARIVFDGISCPCPG